MLVALCIVAIVAAVCVRIYPTTHFVKLLLFDTVVFGAFAVSIALLGICHNKPKLLYPLLFVVTFVLIWMVVAHKDPDIAGLRKIYIIRLEAHEGVKYMPGGETDKGVDGCGLAKSSFWQAMMVEGLREFNPRLLGKLSLDFWLADMNNQDLLNGKLGYTRVIDRPKTLVGYNSFLLDSGDMAITSNAENLLIYMGEGEWIMSDQKLGRVRTIRTITGKSLPKEFYEPLVIVRWWLLDTGSSTRNN